MSFTTWTPPAVSSSVLAGRGEVWRMVEAQHIAATMKLVDSRGEQDVLATPFRYAPKQYGSRFRAPTDPGVFYGAESVEVAGAELGYWRWRFLVDAVALERIEPVAHTAFRVAIATSVVDLQCPPFAADAAVWQHKTDYAPTQHFARVARDADVRGMLYRSVRAPNPSWCLALLVPAGFAQPAPHAEQQTWFMAVSRHDVTLRRDTASMQFSAAGW